MLQTTYGHAALRDGRVTIRFGILGDPDHPVELDVTVYALALARDIIDAENVRTHPEEN